MSRSVRDLRDLICVSRLAITESEQEEMFSGDDGKLDTEFKMLSVSTKLSSSGSERCQCPNSRIVSPDSGCITNESPGFCSEDLHHLSSDTTVDSDARCHSARSGPSQIKDSALFKMSKEFCGRCQSSLSDRSLTLNSPVSNVIKLEKKRRKKKVSPSLILPEEKLKRLSPLPPVQNSLNNGNDQCHRTQSAHSSPQDVPKDSSNFDAILPYMDATIVNNWLVSSNAALQALTNYCKKGDNFVQFSHFWLSEFTDSQKKDILSMEYDILLDEIALAFAVGRENRKVVRKDILNICGDVFKEYPVQLLSPDGSLIFLDYLDILSSEKQDRYKKLLSNVCCSTSNRQYAQWLLATRSFALMNVWSSVLNFYKNLIGEGVTHGMPVLELCSSKESIPHRRMLQAIRLGYTDVMNYLIEAGHVSPGYSDSHNRSLLFTSVMYGQTEAVRYLLTQDSCLAGVNQPADTGNTALHAGSNSGNAAIVEMLCQCKGIDVNCKNSQCENATPLHLAVMHGHVKVVECLLKHGADTTLKMGDLTVSELARDFDHKEILALLEI